MTSLTDSESQCRVNVIQCLAPTAPQQVAVHANFSGKFSLYVCAPFFVGRHGNVRYLIISQRNFLQIY